MYKAYLKVGTWHNVECDNIRASNEAVEFINYTDAGVRVVFLLPMAEISHVEFIDNSVGQ